MRNRQFIRQLRLLFMLTTGRHRITDLGAQLGVTPRTIFRDINALEEAHVTIVKNKFDGVHVVRVMARTCPICSRANDVQVDPVDDPDGPWGGGLAVNHKQRP